MDFGIHDIGTHDDIPLMPGHFAFHHFNRQRGILPAELDGEDLEQALAAFLKINTQVTAIVGERIYPIAAPQTAALPHLTYAMISGGGVHHLGGYSGISMARIRIKAQSRRLRDCTRLREVVRQLDGFTGLFGPVKVLFCRFEDIEDDYLEPPEGSDVGTYERKFDLRFRYREPVPVN